MFSKPIPPVEIDLDAYFARIGCAARRTPTLAVLNTIIAHHISAIPFENLDVLLGRPILLDPASLQKKLVRDRRGGYCFEQNGLLLLVLSELGFRVTPLSARVRIQRPRDFIPPRTHLFIRVEIAGEAWLADVGIGGLSPTAALRLNDVGEQSTLHEPHRILREDGRFFRQAKLGEEWSDVCEFTGEEMPLIDREVSNWWTSTNPSSTFRQNLMVARAGQGGTRLAILNREFTIRGGARIIERRELATPAELREVLARYFDLSFPAGTRFGEADSLWSMVQHEYPQH